MRNPRLEISVLLFFLAAHSMAADTFVKCKAQPTAEETAFAPLDGKASQISGRRLSLSPAGPLAAAPWVNTTPGGNGTTYDRTGPFSGILTPVDTQSVLSQVQAEIETQLKNGSTSVTIAPLFHKEILLQHIGSGELTPTQQQRLNALGYGGSQTCTRDVTLDAHTSQNALISSFGNASEANTAMEKYLADPSSYASDPRHATKLVAAATAMKAMLASCFSPPTSSAAYEALQIPKRLGFIVIDDAHECEALLLSRDHILTARHCWFESKAMTAKYQAGHASFIPAGDRSKQYQVCAAESKTTVRSTSLSEEQVVMRIAPVDYDLPPVDTFDANSIVPFIGEDDTQPTTRAVIFSWVQNAAKFNAAFENDLAVGSTPCYVAAYDKAKQCFTNMCMTYQGTSGGAMLTQTSDGAWKLLGMHIGANMDHDGLYPHCTSTPRGDENTGLPANTSLIGKFSQGH